MADGLSKGFLRKLAGLFLMGVFVFVEFDSGGNERGAKSEDIHSLRTQDFAVGSKIDSPYPLLRKQKCPSSDGYFYFC